MLTGFKSKDLFMILMIMGIVVSTVGVATVLYQIWASERNKADTLSLYAYLKMDRIKKVYDKCDIYLENLIEGSITSSKEEDNTASEEGIKLQMINASNL